jgi:hypothetical protein
MRAALARHDELLRLAVARLLALRPPPASRWPASAGADPPSRYIEGHVASAASTGRSARERCQPTGPAAPQMVAVQPNVEPAQAPQVARAWRAGR